MYYTKNTHNLLGENHVLGLYELVGGLMRKVSFKFKQNSLKISRVIMY